MGRHQHAETRGLVSFAVCALVGWVAMESYLRFAPAIWMVSLRLFTACSIVAATCGVGSFVVGYAHRSRSLNLKHGWLAPLRRLAEIASLSLVFGSTIFVTVFMIFVIASNLMGMNILVGYVSAACAGVSGIAGYFTFVQAEMMSAKSIVSLLPIFMISGIATAGLTSDDPYWYKNNFSQLGDRTTFAASMFNTTLILAGICVSIVGYFAISELITTNRQRRDWLIAQHPDAAVEPTIRFFRTRMAILMLLLTMCGVCFIGIGSFRYTPHPLIHNIFSHSMVVFMALVMVGIPWLAPQVSRAFVIISDVAVAVACYGGIVWFTGHMSMTNIEALVGVTFLGWFVMFSRQIAALEADRVEAQVAHLQSLYAKQGSAALPVPPTSRLDSQK